MGSSEDVERKSERGQVCDLREWREDEIPGVVIKRASEWVVFAANHPQVEDWINCGETGWKKSHFHQLLQIYIFMAFMQRTKSAICLVTKIVLFCLCKFAGQYKC